MPPALQDIWHAIVSIPHLGLYLTLGWLGYLVWLGLWIVLQKREPVATLSWLISLAALPFVGFVVYYFSGHSGSSASACAASGHAPRCRRRLPVCNPGRTRSSWPRSPKPPLACRPRRPRARSC